MICTPPGQSAVYEELSSMAFVNGYISVMGMKMDQVKVRMLNHLQEMVEDGGAYVWPAILFYYVAWLQHLEPSHMGR